MALNDALVVVLGGGPKEYAIPEWEFHTLVGVRRPEAVTLLKQTGAILNADGWVGLS
jgi:hypothetical protein